MKTKWCLSILLAAMPLTPAVAGVSDWLPWNWFDDEVPGVNVAPELSMHAPDLPGYRVAYEKANRNLLIREEVPKDQTVQRWSKMVTTQWFRKLGERLSPGEYAARMLADLPKACPGATASPVHTLKVAGYDAARIKVVCPSTANGMAESFFLLAVEGDNDMYVKQVAFRGEASAADFLWARKFLAGVMMCKRGSKHHLCY
jgi:hypothetical protein